MAWSVFLTTVEDRSRPQHGPADDSCRLFNLRERLPELAEARVRPSMHLLGCLDRTEDALPFLRRESGLEGLHRAHRVGNEAVDLPLDSHALRTGLAPVFAPVCLRRLVRLFA